MKKIIIVNNNLNIGGIQISLINLLKELNALYDVTLLLFHADKQDMDKLPENIKVMIISSPFMYFGMSSDDVAKSFSLFIGRSFWAAITKIFGRSFATRLMALFQKKIKGYDCAVSYLHEGPQKSFYGGCNEFVLKKIDAKQKITWVHCDFELCGANNSKSKKIYEKFDWIVACSDGAKESFLRCLPELKDKCVSVRNCNDYELIREKALPAMKYDTNCFNVVTVARLSGEKGIDRMIHAVAKAKETGYKMKYHIVGDGQEESALRKLVTDLDLKDDVFFYGNQSNPYPYIMSADLFVLPSYHEAAPMVFDESASLGVPVLATKTTSTDEMIIKENAGYVCENSQEGITQALLSILSDKSQLIAIAENLKKRTFSNQGSIDAVVRLF